MLGSLVSGFLIRGWLMGEEGISAKWSKIAWELQDQNFYDKIVGVGGNKPFFRVMRRDLASPPRKWNPGGVKNVTKWNFTKFSAVKKGWSKIFLLAFYHVSKYIMKASQKTLHLHEAVKCSVKRVWV